MFCSPVYCQWWEQESLAPLIYVCLSGNLRTTCMAGWPPSLLCCYLFGLPNLHVVCFCVMVAFCPFQRDFPKVSRKWSKKNVDTSNKSWKLITNLYRRWQSRNMPRNENLSHQVGTRWRPAHVCSTGKEESKLKEHVKLMEYTTKTVSKRGGRE